MQVDITNFNTIYPQVSEKIKSCHFVALDIEFSGLSVDSNCMPSLFDSLEDRYKKLRSNVSNFVPLQFGLSLFTKHESSNEYTSESYSFYCFPRSHGPSVGCFSVEVKAIEFLADHSFDFNKSARHGIPFLNKSKEKILREYLTERKIESTYHIQDKLGEMRPRISDWASKLNSKDGRKQGSHTFPCENFVNPLDNFILLELVRRDFKQFWVKPREDGFFVYSVSPTERKRLLANVSEEEEEVIKSCLGISRLVQDLIEAKKPIIGNNMMIDLVMLYEHFIDTLPATLKSFKKNLLKYFDSIYDVKSLTTNVKKIFPGYEDDLTGRNLNELFSKMSSARFRRQSLCQPNVIRKHDPTCELVDRCHDAGYDAYVTGYIFLRVCAIIAAATAEDRIEEDMQWESIIAPLACFKNKINLVRAAFHYMDLEVESQPYERPEWLVLQYCGGSKSVTLSQVYSKLANYGSSMDFRQISKTEFILAIGNFKTAREILAKFRKDQNYKITHYNMILHSGYGRLLLWTTTILGAGITAYCAFKLLDRTS